MYEACGGAVTARLTAGFPVAGIYDCDLLEEPQRELMSPPAQPSVAQLRMRPFQIRTLRLRPARLDRA